MEPSATFRLAARSTPDWMNVSLPSGRTSDRVTPRSAPVELVRIHRSALALPANTWSSAKGSDTNTAAEPSGSCCHSYGGRAWKMSPLVLSNVVRSASSGSTAKRDAPPASPAVPSSGGVVVRVPSGPR